MISVNTASKNSTHFLRAVELIIQARQDFQVPSENWPNPTDMKFGTPCDRYYAEVWTDGMDWQPSYWIIEEYHLEKPHIQPLIIFNHNEERSRFNDYDFKELVNAIFYYRRDFKWIGKNDLGYYTDMIWPFLTLFKNENRHGFMKLYAFEHASQKRVVFWLNEKLIPEVYRGRRKQAKEGYSDNRNSKAGHICSI